MKESSEHGPVSLQDLQNIILGAHIVIEDRKIAKIAISQKVLGQYFRKKKIKREWSWAMFSRILGTFGTVDPDISGQKDSSGRLFLLSCIFFLKGAQDHSHLPTFLIKYWPSTF